MSASMDVFGVMDIDDLPAKALEWVNHMRASVFDAPPLTELPKGLRGNSHQCVIARCFRSIGQVSVGSSHMTVLEKPVLEPGRVQAFGMPEFVSEFIRLFDNGFFSALRDDPCLTFAAAPTPGAFTQKPMTALIPSNVISWFGKAPALTTSPAGMP